LTFTGRQRLFFVLIFTQIPRKFSHRQPVRLAYQPPDSSSFLSQQTGHQQPASSTFLSEPIISHQPNVHAETKNVNN
jgi:hypothetical protein